MPTYNYKCNKCNSGFSVVRGMTEDDPGYSCDTCKNPMIRVYSLSGITFKGSGFYRTDK